MSLNNPILDAALNTISLEEIKAQKGPAPWVHTVVLADHLAANLIYQNAGATRQKGHYFHRNLSTAKGQAIKPALFAFATAAS